MIIITGVSGSLGKELFEHYHHAGISVIGTYNSNLPEIENTSNIFQLDITDYTAVLEFTEIINHSLENICLVNCAATVYDAFAHKADVDMWKNVIDINLCGTFNMIRALLPVMRNQEFGRIINISSIVAQTGAIGTSAYAASKSGLWGMTKSIAIENANKNILINSINLGYMESGMTTKIPEEIQMSIKEKIPFKKFGKTTELIQTIDYLINSDYVTGTSIDVNGGLF